MPHSPMYDFAIAQARQLATVERPLVLDFGCGRGELVELGLAQGLDMVGVDTFTGWFDKAEVPAPLRGRIFQTDGTLPFPDGHFDVIVSNQVFEHIQDPTKVLPELRRVLKPGGAFLAMFPVLETWFEPHVGLYLAHRLLGRDRLFRSYLKAAYWLGLGNNRGEVTPEEWAARLTTQCAYHRTSDVRRWWQEVFGTEPVCLDSELMAFRLPTLRKVAPKVLLRAVARVRVGLAVVVRRPIAI